MKRRRRPARPRPATGTNWFRLHDPAAAGPSAVAPARHAWWDAAVLAAFALVVGWILVFVHRVGDYFTESDFYGAYADGARMFLRGAPDPSRYGISGPVYDATLALASLLVPEMFLAAKILSALSAIVVLLCWRGIVRAIAGPRVAFWLVLLLAVNPVFLQYSYAATTDMLAMALQAVCLLTVITRRTVRAVVAAGVFAGLAAFTRYSASYLVVAGVVVLMVDRAHSLPGRGRRVLGFLAGVAIVAAPWIAFSLSSGFVPGSGLLAQFGFYMTSDASRNVQDRFGVSADSARASLNEFVRRDPLAIPRRFVVGILTHLVRDAHELLWWPAAVLCAVGGWLVWRSPERRTFAPIALAGLVQFLVLAPVFYSDRYSLPLAPMYLSFGAAAAGSRWFSLSIPRAGLSLKAVAVVAVVLLSAFHSIGHLRRYLSKDPHEVVEAARVLARVAAPADRVLSRKGHIGYYSGRSMVSLPRLNTLAELGEFARASRARFLYYSWLEAGLRPELAYLLHPRATIPGLTRVFETSDTSAVLYRIEPGFGAETPTPLEIDRRQILQAEVLVRVIPDSSAAPWHVVLSNDAVERRSWSEAIDHAAIAIKMQPHAAVAWRAMGNAQVAAGSLADARLSYERALECDPADIESRLKLGWALLKLGQPKQAALLMRPLVDLDLPAEIRADLARVFTHLGDSASVRRLRRIGP